MRFAMVLLLVLCVFCTASPAQDIQVKVKAVAVAKSRAVAAKERAAEAASSAAKAKADAEVAVAAAAKATAEAQAATADLRLADSDVIIADADLQLAKAAEVLDKAVAARKSLEKGGGITAPLEQPTFSKPKVFEDKPDAPQGKAEPAAQVPTFLVKGSAPEASPKTADEVEQVKKPARAEAPPDRGLMRLTVNDSSIVTINGNSTSQSGVVREFVTTAMAPGTTYTFDVVVDGRAKRILLAAGKVVSEDFTK